MLAELEEEVADNPAVKVQWEEYLERYDPVEETQLRMCQTLTRLPSVWEEHQEVDEDGVLQMFYVNVETGECRYETDDAQRDTNLLKDVLDNYRGEGDWGGADEDEDDEYAPDLDDACVALAAKLKQGKAANWGDGDWFGAEENDDDFYEPGLEDAFTLLSTLLRGDGGDWAGADADEDDSYSPDGLPPEAVQALALLDRVAKQRRKNIRVERAKRDQEDAHDPDQARAPARTRGTQRAAAALARTPRHAVPSSSPQTAQDVRPRPHRRARSRPPAL